MGTRQVFGWTTFVVLSKTISRGACLCYVNASWVLFLELAVLLSANRLGKTSFFFFFWSSSVLILATMRQVAS